MLFPTCLEKNSRGEGEGEGRGVKNCVVLASEPVGGRSRANELPCSILDCRLPPKLHEQFSRKNGGKSPPPPLRG